MACRIGATWPQKGSCVQMQAFFNADRRPSKIRGLKNVSAELHGLECLVGVNSVPGHAAQLLSLVAGLTYNILYNMHVKTT